MLQLSGNDVDVLHVPKPAADRPQPPPESSKPNRRPLPPPPLPLKPTREQVRRTTSEPAVTVPAALRLGRSKGQTDLYIRMY